MKRFRQMVGGGKKAVSVGLGLLGATVASPAFAALDVTGVQTALDSNLSVYETVAVAIIGFVLGVAVIYGIIGLIKGRAR